MRKIISLILLGIVCVGIIFALYSIPFGKDKIKVGKHYIYNGIKETGAVNIVTSVVLNYRGFDTLGEVTILFIAALGLGVVLYGKKKKRKEGLEPASLVLYTGCRFLFPLILLFGAYIFIHGHLTPGGGFQGGAIIASGFLLSYLGCPRKWISKERFNITESLGGLVFVIMGLIGLTIGGYFLSNFLPKGIANTLFSAGIIPILYCAVGFKVGAELAGIIYNMIE
ncbi:Na(+)/H(+) antiporter subunit B [candidate division WOR-3 bacterium]|nr:Na(+)/H(+) antiporter subunit B [candidate division WOR-3 bacterium]